jgi:beta-lactamase regulating signal transducer with metallopeptidase domain
VTPFTLISANVAAALFSAIWQGAILAFLVALCLRALPVIPANVRSLLWTAVFAVVLALHFVPMPYAAGPAAAHPVRIAPIWSVLVAGAWVILSVTRASHFLLSVLRLREIVSRAKPVDLEIELPGIARRYALCTSEDVDRPSVLGFFSPRILLPPDLLAKLTLEELRQVLLHETEHLRRSDDWTNLLQKLALVLFPLNPVLFWVERRLCLERELACDDRVLSATGARKAYATCLTQLAEHSMVHRGITLALGALGNWNRQSELVARVHRILRRPEPVLTGSRARFATAALLAGVLGVGATLAHAPRLISFAPVALAPALESASAVAPAHYTGFGAHETLAKAVLPATNRAPSFHPVPAVRRRAILRRSLPANGVRVMNTRLREVRMPQPRMMLTLSSGPQVQQFYVPTVARVAVAYAVATPDGWIIIQL